MDKVIRAGVTLSARCTGSGPDERTILMIHGLNTNMAFWHSSLVRGLGVRHKVLMYDQRGHGYSSMPASGYTLGELARDAEAVLDSYDVSQAHVVGHSFGSGVALQFARLFPERVRTLTILDGRVRLLQPEIKLGEWPDFERWRVHMEAAGVSLDPSLELDFRLPLRLEAADLGEAGRRLAADGFVPIANGRRGAQRYRKLLEETTAIKDYVDNDGLDLAALHAIDSPVLAVYGSRSPFLKTLYALERELPQCITRYVEDGGHNFPIRFPQQTAEQMLDFLDARSGCVPDPMMNRLTV